MITKALPVLPEVPCGKCFACCHNSTVVLFTHLGDDPSQYRTRTQDGAVCLQVRGNKDCVYLSRKDGCTIHATRPAMCRLFDCRDLLLLSKEKQYKTRKRLMKQARRMVKEHGPSLSVDEIMRGQG